MLALDALKDIPPDASFRKLTEENVRWRLKVLEDNENIQDIEK